MSENLISTRLLLANDHDNNSITTDGKRSRTQSHANRLWYLCISSSYESRGAVMEAAPAARIIPIHTLQ